MRYIEEYRTELDQDGNPVSILVSSIPVAGSPEISSGVADLVAGRATVETSFAGKSVILSRIQDNTTAVGSLYVHTPSTVTGVSFQIRSSNANDVGSVYWEITD